MNADNLLLTNCGQVLTMAGTGLGLVENGWVMVEDGRIAGLGTQSRCQGDLEHNPAPDSPSPSPSPSAGRGNRNRHASQVIDCRGCVVMPGFVDPHTHLVFGGWRADEFEQRLLGRTYKEIAQAGGGILSTVKATRSATEDELYEKALARLREMSAWGTTTVEVKSGYGLETETELRMLRVARRLGEAGVATVVPTFLGAHAVPKNSGPAAQRSSGPARKDDYIRLLIQEMLPKVAEEGLARFCDVFCESIAFSPDETERILEAAKRHGLLATVHADEIESSRGAEVAARVGAVSASHLLQPSDAGLQAMAKTGVVAILLPGTSFLLGAGRLGTQFLGDLGHETSLCPASRSRVAGDVPRRAPVAKMRELGITMAVATDFNPGSCTLLSQSLALQLACIYYGLTIVEALRGVTVNAARALKLESETGTLEPGRWADIVVTDVPDYRHLAYRFGHNPVRLTIRRGRVLS